MFRKPAFGGGVGDTDVEGVGALNLPKRPPPAAGEGEGGAEDLNRPPLAGIVEVVLVGAFDFVGVAAEL